MKEEDIIIIGTIVCLLIVMILVMIKNNFARKKRLLERIREGWGKVSDREYSENELAGIKKYSERMRGEQFYLDDITWNDLGMDDIFFLINNTMSSCGEDYLYAMLRLPLSDEKTLDERERLITYFSEHENERIALQRIFASIGKIKDISLTDYVYRINNADRKKKGKYIFLCFLSFISIVTLFLMPLAGVLFFLAIAVVNISVHLKDSSSMEPYFKSLSCILRVLYAADELKKLHIPEIKNYTGRIAEDAQKMKTIKRKARMLTNSKGMEDFWALLASYINSFFLLDFIMFYGVLDEYDGHIKEIEELIELIGILDSALAVSSFREYLPFYSSPEFIDEDPVSLEVHDLDHPLISDPVANSICVSGGVLITGSNASGKSTFLKMIAVNAILAQSMHTCIASQYRACKFKVMTSMALHDNLLGGESYFIVEIKSLKRIMDEAEKGEPLLCIIDEVLRGTNTIERIAASSEILNALSLSHVVCFAATHDIELSQILKDVYENYHFEEEVTGQDVRFNYMLKPGNASSRNAITLLEMLGYDKSIVKDARAEAGVFETEGIWKPLKGEDKNEG